MCVLVTGGAGFIGVNFINDWLRQFSDSIINLDKLTYSSGAANLDLVNSTSQKARGVDTQKAKPEKEHPSHHVVVGDICDVELIQRILQKHRPRAVVHFAAESHVDRSIHSGDVFVQTNVLGTQRLFTGLT